jgi:ABC-type dipeptide/oligopeptide/nickel transport system permease component
LSRYVIRRLLVAVPLLLAVTGLTFLLLHALPGDPVLAMAGERFDESAVASLREQLGLDKPLGERYLNYMGGLVRGDLGRSFVNKRPVAAMILERFPKTLLLAGAAMLFACVFGVSAGVISAAKPGSLADKVSMTSTFVAVSLPVFWLGLILIFLVSVKLKLLPPSGFGGFDPRYLILPAITLGAGSAGIIARITRSSMLEAVSEDYIVAARAKGLGEFRVMLKHALRNALVPVVTVMGTDFGSYLSGAVLTESIFGWPGVGRLTLDAILKRDLPVIEGSVLFMAIVFVFVNLAVDLSYALIDPRVRVDGRAGEHG